MRLILALAAASLVLDWSLQPVLGRDSDFWWHLAAGREIWACGSVPLVDSFSHTFAGQPWLRLHWLFQALLYGAWTIGGMNLAIAFRSMLFLGAMALLARAAWMRGAREAACTAAVLWVAWIASRYSFIRPHFLSLFLGALILVLLETARQPGRARLAWLVPPVLMLWSNGHGGVAIVGVGIVLAYAAAYRSALPWRWLVPLSALAVFIVPQPLETFPYALAWSFRDNPFRDIITEFKAPEWTGGDEGSLAFLAVFLAGALASRSFPDLLLLAVFSPLLLTGWRHQFLLIPFLAPGLAVALHSLARPMLQLWKPPRFAQAKSARVLLAAVLLLVGARSLADAAGRALPPSRLIRHETLPEAAVDALRAEGVRGRLFNDLNWGGYLIWALPESPVFIDSRCDQVYRGQAFLDEYFGVLLGRSDALGILDRRRVDVVIENPLFAASPLFARLLPSNPRWVRLEEGAWVRRALVLKAAVPDGYAARYRLGMALMGKRALDEAAKAFASSLTLYPDFAAGWLQLGLARAVAGRADEAERAWRQALRIHPEMPGAHHNLGILALRRGRPDEAAWHFAREVAVNPTHSESREALRSLPAPGAGAPDTASRHSGTGLWRRSRPGR
jgi:tetratricopeptide (TPR) repeat protein